MKRSHDGDGIDTCVSSQTRAKTMSHSKSGGGNTNGDDTDVDDTDSWEARCRLCHMVALMLLEAVPKPRSLRHVTTCVSGTLSLVSAGGEGVVFRFCRLSTVLRNTRHIIQAIEWNHNNEEDAPWRNLNIYSTETQICLRAHGAVFLLRGTGRVWGGWVVGACRHER